MWYKRFALMGVIGVALLNGCVSASGNSSNDGQHGTPMNYEVLLTDGHSNYDDMTSMKIATEDTLQTVFSTINSTRKPGYVVPEVDFSRSDLYFFAAGNLSTGGHSLEVHEVVRFEDKIEVRLIGNSPGPGEYATTVISSPFILVKFNKTDLPVIVVFVSKA